MEKKPVYLDYAASTPLDPEVFEVMKPYLLDYVGNPSSTHQHGRMLRTAIEQSRRTIATNLQAHPHEIVFTSGGTEADNIAIRGAVETLGVKHVISTSVEHHAVSHTLEALEKSGKIRVSWLPIDREGGIDLEALRRLLQAHPQSLVSLMHANNELGNIYDLQKIAEMCKEEGAYLHSDTVQTMGNLRYDLKSCPVDFLAASAHKFYGPKGIGFLFVRKGLKLPALITGGSQERSLRAGTENVASIVGMAHALNKCMGMLDQKWKILQGHKTYMKAQLQQRIPGIAFNGFQDFENTLPTILNVAFPGEEDCMLTFNLDIHGISASGGSACSSGAAMGSHVLRALGHADMRTINSVRFSFGLPTTREEIDFTLQTLQEILSLPIKQP